MKLIINSLIILSFIFLVYWNNSPSKVKAVIFSGKPHDPTQHEEKLKQALEYKYPQYFIKWQQKLITDQSPLLNISENADSIITKIEFSKNGSQYLYVHTQFKEEVTYRVEEHNVFEFEVVFYENNHVVFQFSGHINNNLNPPKIENLDVLAFMEGFWEENLITIDSAE